MAFYGDFARIGAEHLSLDPHDVADIVNFYRLRKARLPSHRAAHSPVSDPPPSKMWKKLALTITRFDIILPASERFLPVHRNAAQYLRPNAAVWSNVVISNGSSPFFKALQFFPPDLQDNFVYLLLFLFCCFRPWCRILLTCGCPRIFSFTILSGVPPSQDCRLSCQAVHGPQAIRSKFYSC